MRGIALTGNVQYYTGKDLKKFGIKLATDCAYRSFLQCFPLEMQCVQIERINWKCPVLYRYKSQDAGFEIANRSSHSYRLIFYWPSFPSYKKVI